jgi:MFS transporter, Spinster family, sphingosine-1-phosphate transporter
MIYFAITSLSAPIGGVIIGGIVTSKLGGYNTPKAMKLQCLMGFLSVICGLPIPFTLSFPVVGTLFWFVLFFGGFILP